MESLTLEQLSSVAEIIGAILIVISLVYVAVQIRQNTMAIRSDTAQSVHDSWGGVYGRMSINSELSELMMKGNPGIDGLSESEKAQYISFWMHTMLTWQNAYYQFKTGTLERRLWTTMEKTMLNALLSSPGMRQFWKARKYLFDDDYREYVDSKVSTGSLIPGYKVFGVQEPTLDPTK